MLRLSESNSDFCRLRVVACAVAAALSLGAEVAHADALTTPAMSGPLVANATPTSINGGVLGKFYVTGAVSGLAFWQSNPVPGDRHQLADISNGQVFIQKTDGLFQYFIQAGGYSLPSLGTPYLASNTTTDSFYGVLPQGFIKLVPNSDFSLMVGKLPTLIGAEYTFTFENMNIERGLLWNQENAVNRGIQANYSHGPVAVSISLNDGFYSKRYNWLWGSLAYTFDPANVLALVGGGNLGQTNVSNAATPLLQNNQDIYNVIYTHTAGAWILQPYLQYTKVAANTQLGIAHSAQTYGAALLANYAFNPKLNLASRVEYISSSGNATDGTPNLLYGPGSKGWSVTMTPTYQIESFFARAEVSYVKATNIAAGAAFGSDGNSKSQARLMIETGVLF
ncbi:MAG: porin [Nevskiaceae bacterium]|nr:MAG: porin [Nevskiaceae bacterium]